MSTPPLRILFAGSGEFGLPTLNALLDAGHQVVQVYSQPDRPAGRGRNLTPTPIARFAIDRSLPLIRTENLNLESLSPADLLVVIAFGQKISDTVANHCRLGSVNLHASLLPKYRGAAPIHWAILRGETITGNSVIRLAQRMDAGAILGQSTLPIDPLETTGELHDRLANDGAPLVHRIAQALEEGTCAETTQDESQSTMAPKLSRDTAKIDWTQPAEVVARHIRGLSPWPGCRVRLLGLHGDEVAKLTLFRARVTQPRAEEPGDIGYEGQVGCGKYTAIEVLELQPDGKRRMSLADFKNARDWGLGTRLESIS